MIHVTDSSDKNVVGRLGEGGLRLLLRGGLPLHSQTLASFSYSVRTLRGTIERNHSHGGEALAMSPAATSAGQLGLLPGAREKRRMRTKKSCQIHWGRVSPNEPPISLLFTKYFSFTYFYGIEFCTALLSSDILGAARASF